MARIKSLTVEKFRGVLDSTLHFDTKSLILHGENGSGKSSFVDAIEFFFTGSVSHLQGAEGVSLDRHGPHASYTKDDSKVAIEFQGPLESVTRKFGGVSLVSATLAPHLDLAAEVSFILRRANLLRFIAAQAASRYEQLAALIGIGDLEAVELNLKRQADEAAEAVKAVKATMKAATDKLASALEQRVDNDDSILEALNERLTALKQQPINSLTEMDIRKETIVARADSADEIARLLTLQTAGTKVVELRASLSSLDDHKGFWSDLADFQSNAITIRDQVYQSVLKATEGLLQSERPAACPVCNRPFDDRTTLEWVTDYVKRRLETLQATAKKYSRLQENRRNLNAAVTLLLSQLQDCQKQLGEQPLNLDLALLATIKKGLAPLNSALQADIGQMQLRPLTEYLPADTLANCATLLGTASQKLQTLSESKPPTEEDKLAVKGVELLQTVSAERSALVTARRNTLAKSAVHSVVSALYQRFSETKKAEVQRVFSDLQDDIRRFYDIIHPGEGHRAVSLLMPPGRRSSALIKMGFYHHGDEDPRGYNSEAHLDSLGVCIFLAFTKRFNGGFPLIVLDDVVSSVDAAHRARVCRLLCQEFSDVQLLITTHDYLWMEEWESHQRGFNLTNQFINVRILNWSLDHGPVLDKYKPRWDSLQDKLNAGDREGAASEARRILEWLLREMSINTETPIPITRDGKYTVVQLYDPFLARLKKLNKDIGPTSAAVFQDLQVSGIFGNLLTHNNPLAGNASMAEIQAFVSAVRNFHNLFYCDECGQMTIYDRNDKELKCRCRTKQWKTS